jgi:hypothetical protein
VKPSALTLTVCASLIVSALRTQGATASELEGLMKESARNYQTKEGARYREQFFKAVSPVIEEALHECSPTTPDTKEPAGIVFVVAANGRVKKVISSPNIPFGDCMVAKLRTISTVPRPPGDSWAVGMGFANHDHEEKAADKGTGPMTKEAMAAYDKAIAPYIAKARTTYPEAKKRFLAGLPSGYRFSVRTRLSDPDGKVEDSFLQIEKIEDGKITGVLGAVDLLHSYKEGQRITISEDKIDNWVIVRPDGTEEGNYVGKFLDHYKPQ